MTPPTKVQATRIDYCQYLLSSQINYTLTYFADHSEQYSHDAINRLLAQDKMTPRLVWENVQGDVKQVAGGYLVFDDTVSDKRYSRQIELVRRQYSGNAHGVIRGIGIVTCVYVNPETDDRDGVHAYQRVDTLRWTTHEQQYGKLIKIKDFPKGHRVKLFRLVLSTQRTDFVVTNDLAQDDTQATHLLCGLRWKIEQFHRETKQLSGLEGCQCWLARIVRNHIACAMLVWVRLKQLASQSHQTVYQLKHGLLDDYMYQQLKHPTFPMSLA